MHGAPIGDLEQAGALLVRQRARQLDLFLEEVDRPRVAFTFGDFRQRRLAEAHPHPQVFQRPLLPPGVHPHRDRRAGPEGGDEQLAGRRPRVRAPQVGRLVGRERVPAHLDPLRVAVLQVGDGRVDRLFHGWFLAFSLVGLVIPMTVVMVAGLFCTASQSGESRLSHPSHPVTQTRSKQLRQTGLVNSAEVRPIGTSWAKSPHAAVGPTDVASRIGHAYA